MRDHEALRRVQRLQQQAGSATGRADLTEEAVRLQAWHEVDAMPLVQALKAVVEHGRQHCDVAWGPTARELWTEVYGELSEGKPGLFGAATSRAEAQTLRLAALYAVTDSSRTIEREHLEAALALWRYAEASARYIFGDSTGDPVADRIDGALADLKHLGKAQPKKVKTDGRPAERWCAT